MMLKKIKNQVLIDKYMEDKKIEIGYTKPKNIFI